MNGADDLSLRADAGGTVLAVKVVPGASRDKLAGALGEELKITTSAPPEKGKANAAVGKLLARALGVDRKAVTLVAGPSSPRKEFHVAGLSPQAVRERLARA